ncbi:LPS export ABC transporter permease LptG [Methylibium rhizosphaerae]|uniref:LPS export ABC transporter permease LptG n=1 Tax=Methylibium rhizosphaerae TaxID=2570323 RepID=UPI00112B26DB|nr:LPS export ABC transporter permease LptG [Methylibium rhizosphaerae]
MRTVRRLLYADILGAVTFVTVAFLALFFFIDFVDELEDVGKRGYGAWHAALYCLLEMPGHFYELFPITVLIGSIYAMARLAQSSEFTILRTGGLGPGRALSLLAVLGAIFGVLTFVVGDFVAPLSEREATLLHARFKGGLALGRTGAWLKDSRQMPDGEHTFSVNVARATADGSFHGIRIFEFNPDGRLVTRMAAESGRVGGRGAWTLQKLQVTHWDASGTALQPVREERLEEMEWPTTLTSAVVSAAVLPLKTMSTASLFTYMTHLSSHEQEAQRYEIQFWKKALYPLACLVMVGLALPFAYLHARGGGVSFKVFGGIMLGISFVLLNNISSHLGLLQNWTPWVAAAMPSVVYLLLSLAAFSWLVRYR